MTLAAVLWASSGSAAKYLFAGGITPFQMVQLRLTIAAVGLLVALLIRRPDLLKISLRDIPYFFVLATLGLAAVNITYMFAISKIHVAAAILLQYTAPVFIAVYLILFEKKTPGSLTLVAMAGALVGCFFVVGAYNPNVFTLNVAGIASGLLSGVTFAWWSVHGEYGMRRYNSWTVLFYAAAVGAVEWNILHPPFEAFRHSYSPIEWLWILHIGIMGTLMPFGLYLMGVKHIQATRASITATLEPITAGVIAWVFLNEAMDILQLAGALLVIASIVMLQMKPVRDVDPSG